MNLNLIYEERWLTDSAFETLVACAVGVFSRPWPCKGSVSRSSNFLLKSSCLRKNACNCSITVFPLWAVSTGVLKRGSRTRDTVGVDDLRGVGMTAGTKGVDSVVSRKVLIDPWELPDASRILGVEWTAELSSWCSGRPQACTPCETIVLEVLLDLAGVLRVSDEHLEGLVDCSVMIRCLDLLGICLAMDSPSKRTVQFETKSEKSRLKFKCNSSPCRSWSLTTLKNILIYHWVMQDFMLSSLLEYIIAVSVQSLLLFAACACIVFSADRRARVRCHRKKTVVLPAVVNAAVSATVPSPFMTPRSNRLKWYPLFEEMMITLHLRGRSCWFFPTNNSRRLKSGKIWSAVVLAPCNRIGGN